MERAGSKRSKIISKTCTYVVLILIAFIFIGPIIFLIVSSFKPWQQIESDMSNIHAFIPYGILNLDNYVNVFVKANYLKYFKNSIVVTAIFVISATFLNAMVGYALGMLKFRFKKIAVSIVVALSIIPTESIIINRFILVNQMGLLNTYIGLAIPTIAYPMYIYLYYNHFRGMPVDIQEAAIIDGASYWTIFTKIMLPLSKPIVTTVAIQAFIRSWGDLLWPTLVTRDDTFRTLPLALRTLYSDTYTDWGQVFAFSTLMVIPTIIIFLIFQKQFVESVTTSGIKG